MIVNRLLMVTLIVTQLNMRTLMFRNLIVSLYMVHPMMMNLLKFSLMRKIPIVMFTIMLVIRIKVRVDALLIILKGA